MSAVSITVIVEDETTTQCDTPASWPGYVSVWVTEEYRLAAQIYITEDKARTLVEQLTAALAVNAAAS